MAFPIILRYMARLVVSLSCRTSGSHIPDEEIRQAEEKFAESLTLAQIGMFNLLDNDVSTPFSPGYVKIPCPSNDNQAQLTKACDWC